uniref:acyl-CoA thioesterase n=1 Tax=Ningiella ruwaisensis TaxID=2364274 RepID=UPI0010A016CF|nr:thioesterase family protein [Ningiella ruwaisensis]
MTIDELLSHATQHKSSPMREFVVPKDWSQGRTVYGGISTAMLYVAAKSYVDDERKIRSLSTNFVGPLVFDAPFNITVEEVRVGSNVSQLQARAVQNGKYCVVVQACFAKARQSKTGKENTDVHDMPKPDKPKFIPQIPKVTPKFLKHFDLSIHSGALPFTGKKSSHYHGWMRFKKPPQSITEAHIIAMIDTWPPTLIQQLRWPAPASTISWNLEFIYPHRSLSPGDWFAYKEETRQAADGYGHTEATVWDAYGEVIALSRQTIAVFD